MRQASTMHSQPTGAALSGDYMTPHRQPGDGNGATNPRVVRSALEQLLESATPSSAVKRNLSSSRSLLLDSSSNGGSRLGHDDGGSSSRSTSSYKRRGFTVSYATAPPSGGPHSDPPSDRGMSSSPSDGDDGVGRGVESVRRNSAHMPLANDRGIASLFGVPRRASDAASARASPPPSPSVDPAHAIPQTSRSLLPEVEQAAGMDGFGGAAMKARRSAAHDSIHGRMFSEEEVGERVRTALQKYEETRDSEEAIVLQGVQEEVERHAERYSSLLAIHNAMKTSNQELQDRLEQVMEQCSSQTQTINELRGEQRGMIEKLAAMEVQLSHAHDTKTVQANVQEEEWAAERARWTSEAEQLRARLKVLTGEVESKSSALDALSATVRALEGSKDEQVSAMQQQHLAECEEIKSKMQSLGGCMTKMEQTLRKKDEEISRLKSALMEAERATHSAGESSKVDAEQAASRIVSLETALHVQTDEVRRRMHAQQVLQEEKKTLQVEMKRIQAALHQSSERQQNGLALLRSIFRSMSGLCRKGASTLGGGNTTPRQGASQEQLPAVVRAEACAKASMDATMAFESVVDPSDLTSLASLSLSSVEEDAEVLRGVEDLIPSTSSLLATARHRRTASAIPASRVGARRGASADEAERPSVRRLVASIDGDLRNMSHGFAEAIREAREMQRGMVALGAHLQETTLGWKRTRSEMESKLEQEKARAHSLEAVCRNTKLRLVQQESALEDFAAREHDWVESEQRTSTHAKDMEAECEELRSRLSEVEAQRDQTEARIREVELELKRSVESMEALKMELRTAQSVADERSSMETYIATITVERNEAKELLAKEQGRANKLTQAMRRGDEEREALKRELAELKEKIKTCHEQLQASRAQVQARRAKEERETHDREVELAHLRESLAVAQSLTESAKSSAADERTRMTAATSAMKEKVAALEAAVYQREASIQEMRVAADLQQETEKATLRDVYDILREVVHARPEESMLVDDCSSPADFFSAAEEANLAEATVAANTTPLSPSTERVEQARLASRTPSKAREGHLRHPHMDRVGQSLSPSTLRAMPALALRHQVLCLVQRAACALARPPAPAASVVVASDGRGWSSSPERRSLFASPLGRHAFQRMEAALPVEEHQRRTMADVDGANMTAPYVGDVADEWDGYTSRLAQEEVFYPRPLSLANSSPSPRPPSPEAAHHSPDEVCPSCRTHAAATSTRRLQPSPRPESSPTESSFILYKSSRSPSVPVHKTRQAFGAPTQILRDRAPNLQPPATAMKRGSFKHGASSTAVLPRQPSPQKASPAEHRIGLGVLGDGTVDGSCSPARPPAFRA